MNRNDVANLVSSVLVHDSRHVIEAIGKILKIGNECIPFLLKLCRDNYQNDFEAIVPVYIPFHAPEMVSWVDNGNYVTPSTLSLYLVESIRTNHEIHARFLLGFSFNIDLVASRHGLSLLSVERVLYELTIEAALRAYERWWEVMQNREVSSAGDYAPWSWFPHHGSRISPLSYRQGDRFAALDFEILRSSLLHHKISQEKWGALTEREKTIILGLKSMIYYA